MTDHIRLVAIVFLPLVALGVKWQIKQRIVIPWALFMGVLANAGLYLLNRYLPGLPGATAYSAALSLAGLTTVAVVSIFFFRDPERDSPATDGAVLSPADGTIVYIREIQNGVFPFAIKGSREIPLREFTEEEVIPDGGTQIGIGMNLLNVHVNRAPIGGRIVRIRRIPGKFLSLKQASSLLENERVLTVIERGRLRVGIVQIASRLVRRITTYRMVGEDVAIGERLGMIRFGSQVDLLLPVGGAFEVLVKTGDEVKAGVTVLAVAKR